MESAAPVDLCLTFRGSEEIFAFAVGTSVFEVAGRIFARSRLGGEPLTASLQVRTAARRATQGRTRFDHRCLDFQGLLASGGGIRTRDLRVMSGFKGIRQVLICRAFVILGQVV